MRMRVGIITISDRAAAGDYADRGGPALKAAVGERGWSVAAEAVVPDEVEAIQRAIRDQVARGCDVVLTTGGTGVSPRDVTPEAVGRIARCELPGFGEVMRRESLKVSGHAILSRCLAAVVDGALVLCLPGKPAGAVECLGFVASAIPHGVEVLRGGPAHKESA